ncbi:hypothetical protein [Aureispira anguillae]|nr:hypothetical protein [Aureispira anguillae]
MKKNFFFWGTMALILVLSASCKKEEVLETAIHEESKVETLATTSNFRGGPILVLRPYVEVSGLCYGTNHSGNSYETLVYVTGTRPYHRKVTVFGWKNANMSSIPNTYTIDIPANSTTSSRVNTFPDATARYNSIKVEINQVLKQDASGLWVTDGAADRTTATIPVQNCYQGNGFGNNNGGGIGFTP